jgi:hypothetical protein
MELDGKLVTRRVLVLVMKMCERTERLTSSSASLHFDFWSVVSPVCPSERITEKRFLLGFLFSGPRRWSP